MRTLYIVTVKAIVESNARNLVDIDTLEKNFTGTGHSKHEALTSINKQIKRYTNNRFVQSFERVGMTIEEM